MKWALWDCLPSQIHSIGIVKHDLYQLLLTEEQSEAIRCTYFEYSSTMNFHEQKHSPLFALFTLQV
jgi:hypothetical protein